MYLRIFLLLSLFVLANVLPPGAQAQTAAEKAEVADALCECGAPLAKAFGTGPGNSELSAQQKQAYNDFILCSRELEQCFAATPQLQQLLNSEELTPLLKERCPEFYAFTRKTSEEYVAPDSTVSAAPASRPDTATLRAIALEACECGEPFLKNFKQQGTGEDEQMVGPDDPQQEPNPALQNFIECMDAIPERYAAIDFDATQMDKLVMPYLQRHCPELHQFLENDLRDLKEPGSSATEE